MKESDKEDLMRVLCGLLALNLMKDRNKGEQIQLLSAAGMSRHEIAALVKTTPGTVSVYLSLAKKKSKKLDEIPVDGGQLPGEV